MTTSAPPNFSADEYRDRLQRTRERMAAAGIDVMLCSHPANMNYLTGYDGWSFYVHQLVLVTPDDDPVWVGRAQDSAAARATAVLDDDHVIAYSDDHVQSATKHPLGFVGNLLRERGLDRVRIGAEMDTFYFPARSLLALQHALPNAEVVDASALVAWVKAIKSPAEIECMRRAARICERAMATALEMVDPANRQCDAAAAIFQTQIAGTAEFGGDYPAIVPMLPSGEGVHMPHLTWSDRHFATGEATVVELSGCYRRYHCPMARTIHLGPPPQATADTAKIVVEGLNQAMEAARPGATAEEVEAAWARSIERHGLQRAARIGYSIGLNYPPDWGEGTLSLRPGDTTELQENMCLHVIPGVGWGIEISESIQITPSGGRPLAEFERGLLVK